MSNPPEDPLLDYFTQLYSGPISRAEAQAAGFDQRIASIARFLVRETRKFYSKLSLEGMATYEPEDIILELWIALKERDHKYDSTKGLYLRFAHQIISHKLVNMGERARCVRYPSSYNHVFKVRIDDVFDYKEKARLLTILRSSRDHEPIPKMVSDPEVLTPIDQDIQDEDLDLAVDFVSRFMDTLTLHECVALGAYAGLWGDQPEDVIKFKAQQYNVTPLVMKRAFRTAKLKFKEWSGGDR